MRLCLFSGVEGSKRANSKRRRNLIKGIFLSPAIIASGMSMEYSYIYVSWLVVAVGERASGTFVRRYLFLWQV